MRRLTVADGQIIWCAIENCLLQSDVKAESLTVSEKMRNYRVFVVVFCWDDSSSKRPTGECVVGWFVLYYVHGYHSRLGDVQSLDALSSINCLTFWHG